ncbi:zinc finger, CCHC-type containing protein [Tanacetum coccineum]
MGNNTWMLVDLPLGCKWIFKRKLKVNRTIEKFKARLVIQGFKQKSEIDYFDTYALVARISTIRLLIAMASIHNLIIHQMDVKTTFLNGDLEDEVYKNQPQGFIMTGNENKVDLTKEFLSSRFSMKDIGEADVIFVSTPMVTSEKLMTNNGQAVSKLEYSRVIGCLMYAMTCTRPDIAFAASKKQTCITGSTMESEFVALAAAGKEAEWLKNLLLEIPLWSKPITPISIRCDSVATFAKAYSQMYNGKSRHLGVMHSMIRELIMNGMISIEFLRQGIDTAYLLLYVDNIVLTASFEGLLQQIIGSLHQEFAMTHLGPLNYFLGISVTRDSSGLLLSQKKYAIEILEKAHMVSCNPSRTPVDTESKQGIDGDPVSDPTLYRSRAGHFRRHIFYELFFFVRVRL